MTVDSDIIETIREGLLTWLNVSPSAFTERALIFVSGN